MLSVLPSDNDRLILTGTFAADAGDLFRYWTEPALLATWWAPEAEIEPVAGGQYRLSWPAMEWNLRGHYTAFVPGQRLAFTWKWDHEPDLPEREVSVGFEPSGEQTILTIVHTAYSDAPADQDDRQSHLEGWLHFGERLGQAI